LLSLRYDRGTILIKGDVQVPHSVWDERSSAFRAMALHYREITEFLGRSEFEYKDEVLDPIPAPPLKLRTVLKEYQERAFEAWVSAGMRGVVVLPSGAGKTIVAMKAISHLSCPTLIVVPTIDLLEQWRARLKREFGIEIGALGGGKSVLETLTVATYDSAYLRADEIGNRFLFVVFDEVHHLAAPGYRHIAEMLASPYRLGLTATYEREDGLHEELPRLTGGKVFELLPKELAGRHLAPYTVERVLVGLTPEEQREYDALYAQFTSFLRKRGITLSSLEDFQRFILMAAGDREARDALLARNRALSIAFNSESKIRFLEKVLREHGDEKLIVFTQFNSLAYRISKVFLMPIITHLTPKEERMEILSRFREGAYRAIVTSKVLEEGVDVPDASIAVILSGTGSRREFIQRLGRVLRMREGKRAKLIEVVSRGTVEVRVSRKRKREVV